MSVECFVGEHSNAMSWAVFCIFMYVIGIPLWMFCMLWQHSEYIAKINNGNDMKLKAFVHFYKHEAKATPTKELVIMKYDYQLQERELKKTLKRTKAAVHVTWCDNIKWLFCFWNKTWAEKVQRKREEKLSYIGGKLVYSKPEKYKNEFVDCVYSYLVDIPNEYVKTKIFNFVNEYFKIDMKTFDKDVCIDILQKDAVKTQLGDLFEHYDAELYYWEILEMGRKCLLTGGLVLLAPGKLILLFDTLSKYIHIYNHILYLLTYNGYT
jgi:hypothetical protein